MCFFVQQNTVKLLQEELNHVKEERDLYKKESMELRKLKDILSNKLITTETDLLVANTNLRSTTESKELIQKKLEIRDSQVENFVTVLKESLKHNEESEDKLKTLIL